MGWQGTVLSTTDAGATWTRREVAAAANLRTVSFADADHGWLVTEEGAMFATEDGGAI